jgi:chromosome partitioning protein
MIYTIGGIKGGCGKTTIATNLTILMAAEGRDVLLVDADDQETVTDSLPGVIRPRKEIQATPLFN